MRERYAVSRTALREAYSKLQAKGLLAARPKVGTTVRPKSDWNLLDPEVLTWHLQTLPIQELATDLHALRSMLEPSACAMAAERHTPETLAEIERAYEEMTNGLSEDRSLIEADLKFHLAILNATQNHFIGGLSALIHAAMSSIFEMSWQGASGTKEERLDQHGTVLKAIAERDSEGARRAMEKLLEDSIQDVRNVLET